jgi:hypothetical protein
MLYSNILDNEKYNTLYQLITGVDFPWYYQPDIAFLNLDIHNKNPFVQPSYGFVHTVWDTDHGKVSEVINLMGPLVENFQMQSGVKINNFLRIKINLLTPILGNTPEKYNGAHIDRFTPHQSLIYYLNDSDGDTVIFDKIYQSGDDHIKNCTDTLPIKYRITPKANSLIHLDNGFTYHSSSNPINTSRRITININFN